MLMDFGISFDNLIINAQDRNEKIYFLMKIINRTLPDTGPMILEPIGTFNTE